MRRGFGAGAPVVVLAALSLAAASNEFETVADLIKEVRSALARRTPDKTLAKTLHGVTMIEQIDLRTVEELQSEGAGPESVAALETLLDRSAGKPPSAALPQFLTPARPSIDEQKEFFHRVNINAMHYSAGLPDFICTELMHRYESKLKSGFRGPPDTRLVGLAQIQPDSASRSWSSKDELTVKLSYFENREKYELELLNGKKTKLTYEASGGAISEGDFGSILLELFDPRTATKFQWDHWTHLRKRLTRVYSYHTSRETSHYKIGVGRDFGDRRLITAGRRGFIYADDETAMVMRIVGQAEAIPPGFPVLAQASMMDYDYDDVGGKQFLLPIRIENRLMTSRMAFRNVIEFKNYRKFTGESTISFGDPDADPGKPPQ